MTPLLRAEALSLRHEDRGLLEALNLSLMPGQCWVVLGPNGAGKSTLLETLAGLRAPNEGEVHLHGRPLGDFRPRERARQIGLLLQQDGTGLHNSVLDLALTGSYPRKRHWWDTPEEIFAAHRALEQTGLGERAGQTTDTLSGGELRRAQIARLLVQDPTVALLDEPLANLDIAQQARIAHLLKDRFSGPDRVLMMVLHDLDLALTLASHCLLLDGSGAWLAGPRQEIASERHLTRLFGQPVRREASGHLVIDWETTS
ncbi:MAG: ABC transporter ATP-binding protein [Gammaproteobacteria bacterium]|nr:MAG: ABC transporter ATP-binding protein [Gammaproteobacteria bacterium]